MRPEFWLRLLESLIPRNHSFLERASISRVLSLVRHREFFLHIITPRLALVPRWKALPVFVPHEFFITLLELSRRAKMLAFEFVRVFTKNVSVMLFGVLSMCSTKFQVADVVVKSVVVFVMHSLVFCKQSTNMLFHDKSMFHYVPVTNSYRPVISPFNLRFSYHI